LPNASSVAAAALLLLILPPIFRSRFARRQAV
jgi:hypothetical protein